MTKQILLPEDAWYHLSLEDTIICVSFRKSKDTSLKVDDAKLSIFSPQDPTLGITVPVSSTFIKNMTNAPGQ